MQHMVNKAHTRWVAAHLISGHLAHAGNHRHGTAGHSQGRCSAPKQQSAQKRWPSATEGLSRGATGRVMRSMRGNCDNCSHTPTQTYLHKSAHSPWEIRRPSGLENR